MAYPSIPSKNWKTIAKIDNYYPFWWFALQTLTIQARGPRAHLASSWKSLFLKAVESEHYSKSPLEWLSHWCLSNFAAARKCYARTFRAPATSLCLIFHRQLSPSSVSTVSFAKDEFWSLTAPAASQIKLRLAVYVTRPASFGVSRHSAIWISQKKVAPARPAAKQVFNILDICFSPVFTLAEKVAVVFSRSANFSPHWEQTSSEL